MKLKIKVLNILKLHPLQFTNRILRLIKICTKCGKLLPLDSFHSDKSKKDGKYSSCIECCALTWSSRKHTTKISKALYDAEYRNKNKEILLIKKKEYYEEHKEERLEYLKSWYKTPEGILSKKKASLKRRNVGNIDATTIRTILARQTECFWCSCLLNGVYHIDHVVPVAKGGTNSVDNLVLACPACNMSKSAKDPNEYANSIGWEYGELLMRLDELNTKEITCT